MVPLGMCTCSCGLWLGSRCTMQKSIVILCLMGCLATSCSAIPQVSEINPQNDSAGLPGVRVPRIIPYEIFYYVVDSEGRLALQKQERTMLPDPSSAYVIDYEGAFVSSSKFSLSIHDNGALKEARVESTRTMQPVGDTGKSLITDIRSEEDALAKRLEAISNYRSNYQKAIVQPVAPGEPRLGNGVVVPGTND